MFVFWSLIQYFTVHLLTLYTKVKEILKEIQRYKKQNTFVLFFSGSDELCYLANDICKTGFCNIFSMPTTSLCLNELPDTEKLVTFYPLVISLFLSYGMREYVIPSLCSHSSNISSFYSTHFCPPPPKKNPKTNKNKTKRKQKLQCYKFFSCFQFWLVNRKMLNYQRAAVLYKEHPYLSLVFRTPT